MAMNGPVTSSKMTAADHAIADKAQRKVYRDSCGRVIEKPVILPYRRRQ